MFYRFQPTKTTGSPDEKPQMLHEKITAFQREWAARLSRSTRKLPARRLRALLLLAGTASSLAAALLIYHGLTSHQPVIHRFDIRLPSLYEPISVPESPAKQQALDAYLDSLEKAIILDSTENAKLPDSHDASQLH
jgi:hypothetical protein